MIYLKSIFKYKVSRIWFMVSVSVLALFMAITIISETVLFDFFISYLGIRPTKNFGGGVYYTSDYKDKDDAFEKANELNERINEEGIVLLKNENNVLPLKDCKNISVFGKNSVNLAYGGSGSGAFTVTKETPTIFRSLEEAGFKCNPALKSFYESKQSGSGRGENPTMDNGRSTVDGFGTGETPLSKYTQEVKDSYAQYNDAALVVFTRIGGESFDLPRTMKKTDGAFDEKDHYLELDRNEQELLVEVCANFKKVVVIVNSSATMELGFLDGTDDNDSTLVDGMNGISAKIDGALWIGGPGYSGIMALGRVLNGKVTPSGKTIDTYQRDFTKDPTYQNFADNLVNNGNLYLMDDGSKPSIAEHYLDYEEGIYVGYRYYETRGFTDGEEWYKNNVVFPFGYGLSYTTFEWTLKDASFKDNEEMSWTGEKDKEFSVTVNVKNTGKDYSGKEVVQVYITAPYTEGKVEKAHVVLTGFAKTSLLAPGKDEDITIKFNGYDFASYDYEKVAGGGYVLENGKYEVKVMKNSHEVVASRTFNLTETVSYATDPVTKHEVVNRYDDVSFEEKYGMESVLKRSGWDTTFPKNEVLSGSDKERTITREFNDKVKSTATNNPIENAENLKMPEVASSASPAGTLEMFRMVQFDGNNEVLRDDAGTILVDFDDERWDEYLDILTKNEMIDYVSKGAFKTLALKSIGMLPTLSSDGPVGFVYFMPAIDGENPVYQTCSYAGECVIAATWNVELAYEMGVSVGNEGIIGNVRGDGRPYSGWYAPAVNIHRTPFSGRNFEYYSEDPFISGKLAAQVIKGARSRGVYCQLKHFAVNDQETNRSGVCTWLTEQSLREIYLKPFEIAVKEGGALGIMSSFNRIGTMWTGGDYRLLTEILRDEWGFKGMVITDFNTEPFMDARQMNYAGGDLNLCNMNKTWNPTTAADFTVLRSNVKNVLYATARSNAMNGCGEGGYYITYMAWWEVMIMWVDICLFVAAVIWGVFAVRVMVIRVKRERKEQAPLPAEDKTE